MLLKTLHNFKSIQATKMSDPSLEQAYRHVSIEGSLIFAALILSEILMYKVCLKFYWTHDKYCYTIKRAVSRNRTVSFSALCQDIGFWSNEDSPGGQGRIFMRPKTCIETRQGKSNCHIAKNASLIWSWIVLVKFFLRRTILSQIMNYVYTNLWKNKTFHCN